MNKQENISLIKIEHWGGGEGSMSSDSSSRPKSFTGRTLFSVTKENVLDSSGADLVRKMGKSARSIKTCSVPWLKTSATR